MTRYTYRTKVYPSRDAALRELRRDLEDRMAALGARDEWHPSKIPHWVVFANDNDYVKTAEDLYDELYG